MGREFIITEIRTKLFLLVVVAEAFPNRIVHGKIYQIYIKKIEKLTYRRATKSFMLFTSLFKNFIYFSFKYKFNI